MPKRIAINGMGRIGRLAFRAAWNHPDLQIVAVNDRSGDGTTHAHLLEFDSVHGQWARPIEGSVDALLVDGQNIHVSMIDTPAALPWSADNVDIVLECTGKHLTPEKLQPYFDNGIAKLVVSAPVKDPAALNLVMAVND